MYVGQFWLRSPERSISFIEVEEAKGMLELSVTFAYLTPWEVSMVHLAAVSLLRQWQRKNPFPLPSSW